VHYYNWGPYYGEIIKQASEGKYTSTWTWAEANWKDLNNADNSAIGYIRGNALGDENGKFLDQFIAGLGDGSIDLWKGPLKLQDGTEYLKDGEKATAQQIWYLPALLEGMVGQSVPSQ
jgi:simple sugar transport system substrate-binding protein